MRGSGVCWVVEPPAHGAYSFSGFSVAGALKLVQIPAGARHIQIEELEKTSHHIGECQGAGRGAAGPWDLPMGLRDLGEQRRGFKCREDFTNLNKESPFLFYFSVVQQFGQGLPGCYFYLIAWTHLCKCSQLVGLWGPGWYWLSAEVTGVAGPCLQQASPGLYMWCLSHGSQERQEQAILVVKNFSGLCLCHIF